MPKSSSSYTKLPSVPSALLKEDGIQVERANPNTILQKPLRISALSRFKIQHSSFPLLPGLRADYVLANPPFNDSDTAMRGSAFVQSETKPQVVREAKDNFRKDDDVRWHAGVTASNSKRSWR